MVKRNWKSLLAGMAMLGSAAMTNAAAAAEGCCSPCAGNCHQCEQIFADAGQKLTDQLASMSCCGTESASCCAPESVCDPGCTDPCGEVVDVCGEGCDTEEAASLFGECGSGITIGGWTQFGYQDGPDGAFTGNGAFNNVNFGPAGGFSNAKEWNNFNLNQQGLYINKTADGSNGLDYGYRAEMIYGVDGNEAQSFGNNAGRYDFLNGWDHGIYEWALPQLYAEVASGDLSVKVGHFYTLVGYEVIPSYGNFFLSRQLTFYNSEPFTHTGVLATYKTSDKLTVMGGWTAGWDTGFDRFNSGSNFLGGFTYTISDTASFIYTTTIGNLGWRGDGSVHSMILSNNWSDKISTVHQFDVLSTNLKTNFATTGIADNSTGLINYAFYSLTDKVKTGVRQEWYKADGTSYNTLTYGVNVTPIDKLVIRPEVRHMWAPGANNSAAAPGHADLYNQTVFGVDAILTY